jgi:hypothetical protein
MAGGVRSAQARGHSRGGCLNPGALCLNTSPTHAAYAPTGLSRDPSLPEAATHRRGADEGVDDWPDGLVPQGVEVVEARGFEPLTLRLPVAQRVSHYYHASLIGLMLRVLIFPPFPAKSSHFPPRYLQITCKDLPSDRASQTTFPATGPDSLGAEPRLGIAPLLPVRLGTWLTL